MAVNDQLQDAINGLAGHVGILDAVMKVAAQDLIFVVVALLPALWLWPAPRAARARHQRVAVAAFLAILLALGSGNLASHLHLQARPFVSDGSTRQLIPHAPDNGFPSDHALVAFAVSGALLRWCRRLALAALLLSALIGIARIYVGVHWPGDVAAGATLGVLAGVVVSTTAPWWTGPQRRLSRFMPAALMERP